MWLPARVVLLTLFAAPAIALGQASNETPDKAAANAAQVYFEFEVDKPVMPRADNPRPVYPDALRRLGRGGEVQVQFVVDPAGHADMATFEVLSSTDQSLTASVKDVLPGMRFFPAEAEGRKVRQRVQKAFRFAP